MTHISYSQAKLYLTDKYQWKRRYMDGIKELPSQAMIVGSAVHKGIENMLNGKGVADEATCLLADAMIGGHKEDIDTFGAVEQVTNALFNFRDIRPVESAQCEMRLECALGTGELVGYIDAYDGTTIWDWKTCAKFTSNVFSYRLQAIVYALLADMNNMPYTAVKFVEIKTCTWTDRGVVRIHTFDDITSQEKDGMLILLMNVLQEITIGEVMFLPNPWAMFGGKESWELYLNSLV